MATVTTLPSGARPERVGLSFWMDRVLRELQNVRGGADADAVHDLRVAIRRCRSLAAVMQEVDPLPAWAEMKKLPRKLFRELGSLRDAQVLEDWTKRLAAEGSAVRERLLEVLSEREGVLRASVLQRAGKFDAKNWRELARTLSRRARLVPPGSPAALCLALERYERAHDLHARALRTENAKPWHALRIGVKHFRYTVENLLPGRHASWESELKSVQDILGDVHDLDVLAVLVKEHAGEVAGESVEALGQAIAAARHERLEEYRRRSLGQAALWHNWRARLPYGPNIEAAVAGRLRATGRALDTHPRRSARTAHLAILLFDALGAMKAAPLFSDESSRKILRTAARLHGIADGKGRKSSSKSASELLLNLPVPPGWKTVEWEAVAWVVRYHRGPEPKAKHKRFQALNEEQRALICELAGVMRLARTLRRCGADASQRLRISEMANALLVRVAGLTDSADTAARLAVGKHLLETSLKRPLIIEPAEKIVALSTRTAPPADTAGQSLSAASD